MTNSVMDITSIPTCALHRQAGTVIVRIKMEQNNSYVSCQDYSRTYHRTSVCEQCSRTRFNSYSECDSDLVKKIRPYRSSAARSRYVNVCAAVCLLLLVGSFSPQSTATPLYSRNMDREKRGTESQENQIWANPCDYQKAINGPLNYTPNFSERVAAQARNAQKNTEAYKDTFAKKVVSYDTFESLLPDWSGDTYQWLRKFSMIKENDKAFPKAKVLNQLMASEYIQSLMANIDEVLPAMYKGLKAVVAGMHLISDPSFSDFINDEELRNQLNISMYECRAVLCEFNNIMRSRNLPIAVLEESEVKQHLLLTLDKRVSAMVIYRDTINYLEYISQVFQTMSESQDVPDHA